MKRKILFLILLVAVFVSGVYISAIKHVGSPIVIINFKNNSGKDIKTIDIIHEVGRFGEIKHTISNLTSGNERKIGMWTPGESSFSLVVTFADQRQLTGNGSYIEPGYKITEIIENNEIKSNINFEAY